MIRGLTPEDQQHVFHRRLIYDGYGTGEDKRLVNIIKNVTKLCLDPDDGSNDLSNVILKDISNAIKATEKRANLFQLCDRTFNHLEKAIQLKKDEIESIRSSLSTLELELKYAEKLKKVAKLQECQITEQQMRDIKERKEDLMLKLEKQRINIKTLVEACTSLAKILDGDCEMETG